MQEFIRIMKAPSDPNRVKIIKMLQAQSMCVCEMQSALGIAQPTVSNHLKVLKEAGLVASRKEGLWVNTSPTDGAAAPLCGNASRNAQTLAARRPGNGDHPKEPSRHSTRRHLQEM